MIGFSILDEYIGRFVKTPVIACSVRDELVLSLHSGDFFKYID